MGGLQTEIAEKQKNPRLRNLPLHFELLSELPDFIKNNASGTDQDSGLWPAESASIKFFSVKKLPKFPLLRLHQFTMLLIFPV